MSNRREKNKPQNTINRQLETAVERVKEKNDNLIQLGKFFYSLAGLTYAGAVLYGIMNYMPHKDETIFWGVFAMFVLAVSAWILIGIGNVKR